MKRWSYYILDRILEFNQYQYRQTRKALKLKLIREDKRMYENEYRKKI